VRPVSDLLPKRDVIVVSDETTREELCEAITNMAHTASRLPAHWTDRRAKMHERINMLLDELDARTILDGADLNCDGA
jgi:hypothetical protein